MSKLLHVLNVRPRINSGMAVRAALTAEWGALVGPFKSTGGGKVGLARKVDSLSKAKEIAEDWYLQLRGKLRSGEIKTEKTFREAKPKKKQKPTEHSKSTRTSDIGD